MPTVTPILLKILALCLAIGATCSWGTTAFVMRQRTRQHRLASAVYTLSSDSADLQTIPDEWKGQLLGMLSQIIDPDFNKDIVTLGFVQNVELQSDTRQLSFDVQLTTGAVRIFSFTCRHQDNAFFYMNHFIL